MTNPASAAQSGRGVLAVLRRAKSVKNASDVERDALFNDAERIETWCANTVLGAIVLEAVVWISPLGPFLFKLGNFVADAAVAIGIYGEVRFGHVAGNILKIRLAEANERASAANLLAERLRTEASWRTLTVAQRNCIAQSLSANGEPAGLRIALLANDPESYFFAQQIATAFRDAGWNVGYSFEAYRAISTGVLLPNEDANWPDSWRPVNCRVRDALAAANVQFERGWPEHSYMQTGGGDPLSESWAWVYVGPKPMPQ
jgi:hypothetical protein